MRVNGRMPRPPMLIGSAIRSSICCAVSDGASRPLLPASICIILARQSRTILSNLAAAAANSRGWMVRLRNDSLGMAQYRSSE